MKAVDLTGQRFGRLIVIERLPHYRGGRLTYYNCSCDCGGKATVSNGNLGRCVNSCGCLYKDAGIRKRIDPIVQRVNAMRRYYKRNAKLKNAVDWSLTSAQFEKLVKIPCKYCGYFDAKKLSVVDRVDNSKGYTEENSVPCCRWCNWGKNERTLDEFTDWVERLYERRSTFYSR